MKRQKIKACRICGNADLIPCIDIGAQYLSSIFPEDLNYRDSLQKYPLEIVQCLKSNGDRCGVLQLAYDCDLSEMYKYYPYTSSSNTSMRKILEEVANSAKALQNLKPGDTILDIGCNDGTLLSFFESEEFNLIGIDPAQNIESKVNSSKFKRVKAFFSEPSFKSVSKKKAKIVFSVAMFYHLNDPIQFCRDINSILDDRGVVIIQMAYLPAMIKTNMYDNIVHEHIAYYGTQHLKWILDRAGLEIFDVALNDVYGGSFRVLAKKKGDPTYKITDRLLKNLQEELAGGIFDNLIYKRFMERVDSSRRELCEVIDRLKKEGKNIWVYGASTKGNTIMQYCGIGAREITAAADSNPFKFGKYLIGSDIPIRDEKAMRSEKPDYLLVLPYSFVQAFQERESDLIQMGTRFIVPLPEVKII
ncbi:MAG: class I SAM-dependent methyltransferase [Nanoarchaeota archaeon]|nr:class I SAM-dependent methyltransferase [Nanoarchaeota archaeon]